MNTVITGANRGIGLELTKYYLSQGHQVFALCRESSEQLNSTKAIVIEQIEVTDSALAQTLTAKLANIEIDLLINNAGLLCDEQLPNINFDTVQQQFSVNTLGPLRVTEALLPLLKENGKIAMITSRMGSMADNGSGGRYGYRMSKAALNAASVSLAVDLKPLGISVAILHPGYVQTDMVGGRGDIPASVSAERLAQRIEQLNLNNTGTFWHSNGEELPW